MTDAILVINAGSSSLKFSVFALADGLAAGTGIDLTLKGQIEGIGSAPRFVAKKADGTVLEDATWEAGGGHARALGHLRDWLAGNRDGADLAAVGHRVVHGGPEHDVPVKVDATIMEKLERLVPLAPLHQPHNLAPIKAIAEAMPELPQVACFDTAFHRGHAPVSEHFALPIEFYDRGVRRYGFHGLSYEYIAASLPEVAPDIARGRVVVAHLGNGASMCAIKDGKSIESTMGYTAVDGLPMGTRCGALDAGLVVDLIKQRGMSPDDVEALIYKRSGLQGVSGLSNDMRELLASDKPEARLAVDIFVYRICQELGSLAASLGGLDAFVFTAGIGENAAPVRRMVCEGSEWIGIRLDASANDGPAGGARRISTPDSPVAAWVIPTDEERMIALHTLRVVGG
ncbi:MAG: acetate/propionate family kinase [Alphaproteobacteria bacterium]|jgi:acetate kinase|nr:acetate/propionate family kinase [Alphaproteobacteria bacterium]